MKKLVTLVIVLIIALPLFSQENKYIKEINEQVWKPFIKGFSTGDDELFRSVHSKDIARVEQDSKQILDFDGYFKKVPDSIKAKWSDWKKNIELRFTQRLASDEKAFEVGYYRSTSTNIKTGEKRSGIGKFHVLLQKENGKWKIVMDADTAEGASEENFNKALPMK
jgi:ketosteroid isomerase-like protein